MTTANTLPLDPYELREDFPILATKVHGDTPLVYFDNAASTQRPRQVIDTLTSIYSERYANVHRGIHWLSEQSTDLYEESRELVRRFINAERLSEVVFTTGTTSAINLIANSWGSSNVGPEDEILLTVQEHHSNIVPWQQLAQRTGCRIKFIPIDAVGQLDLSSLDELLTERTKMVSLAAVSNVLGAINPLDVIVKKAREVGALVTIDAAQSVPHGRTDVRQIGADFVAFSGHKMMGPSGVGILYGREELLDAMPPWMGGGSMIRRVTLEGFEPADLPTKFEAGTPPIVSAMGLGAAIRYLEQVGIERIEEHERLLTARAHEVLGRFSSIRILGPENPEEKAGIVSFVVDGIHAHDVAQIMDTCGVAIRAGHHCAMPLHRQMRISASNRASFYFYNTLEEVDQLSEAIKKVHRIFRRQ